jgi:hypothetical protein
MEWFYYKSSVYVLITDLNNKNKTLRDYIVDVLDDISKAPEDVVYTRVTAFVVDDVDNSLAKLLIADYKYPSDDLYRYLPEHEEAASSIVNKLKEYSRKQYLNNPVVLLRILTNHNFGNDTKYHRFTVSDNNVMFLVGNNDSIESMIKVTDTYYYTVIFTKVADNIITYDAGLANQRDLINILMKFFREDNEDVDVAIFIKYNNVLPIFRH